MSTQYLNHTAKPSDYTVRQKLVLAQLPNTTQDQFLRDLILPKLAELQKRKDAKEISQLAFCYRATKDGYKALILWRELPHGTI